MFENNQNKSKLQPKLASKRTTKGGARAGSGRKEGSLTKRSRAIAEMAAAKGITPLEVMMKAMHELLEEADRCDHDRNDDDHDIMMENRIKLLNMAATVAKHAAPYMHPRLSAIEHTGKDGAPLQSGVLVVPSVLSLDEWEQAAQPEH